MRESGGTEFFQKIPRAIRAAFLRRSNPREFVGVFRFAKRVMRTGIKERLYAVCRMLEFVYVKETFGGGGKRGIKLILIKVLNNFKVGRASEVKLERIFYSFISNDLLHISRNLKR